MTCGRVGEAVDRIGAVDGAGKAMGGAGKAVTGARWVYGWHEVRTTLGVHTRAGVYGAGTYGAGL